MKDTQERLRSGRRRYDKTLDDIRKAGAQGGGGQSTRRLRLTSPWRDRLSAQEGGGAQAGVVGVTWEGRSGRSQQRKLHSWGSSGPTPHFDEIHKSHPGQK